jgi:hypothetical protein
MQIVSISVLFALASLMGSGPLAVIGTAIAMPNPATVADADPAALALDKRAPAAEPVTEPVAQPFAAPDEEGDVDVSDDDGGDGGDDGDLEMEVVDANVSPSLVPRKLTSCGNQGQIKRLKNKFKGGCDPKKSKGFRSAHNCGRTGGKGYMCVLGGKATCYTNLKGLNFENGECFL